MAKKKKTVIERRSRYGIGEWYGQSFVHLSPEKRKAFAEIQALPKKERPLLPCPFKGAPHEQGVCTKEGGVCSIRLYQEDTKSGVVSTVPLGPLVTTCPYRFRQDGLIFEWIGDTFLGHPKPQIVGEVGFLEQEASLGENKVGQSEDVGRIDNVLVHL